MNNFLSLDNIDCKYKTSVMLCVTNCKHKDHTWWSCTKMCDEFKPYPGTEDLVEEFKKQTNK